MTSTAHSLVAISIAAKIQDPMIALPLSFASNLLLDMIPHWDFGLGWRKKPKLKLFLEAALDVSFGYLLAAILYFKFLGHLHPVFVLACVFVGQLADWLEVPYLFFNWQGHPWYFFYQIQHKIHHRLDLPWGLIPQIAIVAPLLYFTLR